MRVVRRVPVLSDAMAVQAGAVDNFAPARHAETVATTVEIRRYTFAVRVPGDSMASQEQDSFPEGALLVVEPEMAPQDGDYVIARGVDGEMVFKQFVAGAEGFLLKSLNSRYPTRPLGNQAVVGVVRETIKSFR